ncbi:MAG: hypothetical protein B6I28_02330, partial [Fusobacteriia bacterium 4572_132]
IKKNKIYKFERFLNEIKEKKIKIYIQDQIEEELGNINELHIKIKSYNIFLQILEIIQLKKCDKKERIKIEKDNIFYELELENIQFFYKDDFDFFIGLMDREWEIEISKNKFKLKIPIKITKLAQRVEMTTIVINSFIEQINNIKEKILEKLRECEFGIDKIRDMNLVLDELLLNAIEYGNKNNKEKKIYIEYKIIKGEKIYLSIEDEGEGFDYQNYIDSKKISGSGRGIYIVKKMVDSIKYTNNGKKVEIIKKR